MLSIARSAGIASRNFSRGVNGASSKTAAKKSVTSKPVSAPQTFAVRYYARWSKIVGKMSPEALAKMRQNASQGGKQGHSNVTIRTSNTVGDPWLPPRLTNPFGKKFWNDVINWGKRLTMTYIASPWRVRSVSKQLNVPKISRAHIKSAIEETYIKYNSTLSTFNLSNMHEYVSDTVLKELKIKYGKLVLPPGTKPTWQHNNLKINIVNYVIVQVPAPLNMHFVQVTAKITGNQKFFVKQGNKVVLGKDEWTSIEDTWVLEKILEKPESPWFVVSTKLEHPDDIIAAEEESKRIASEAKKDQL